MIFIPLAPTTVTATQLVLNKQLLKYRKAWKEGREGGTKGGQMKALNFISAVSKFIQQMP